MRNWLYDQGWLASQQFTLPVICVGNITVGGTGKTPHVEYLVRLLSDSFRVAVLSRGYRRKSKGFVRSDGQTPMEQIGDEPWQIKRKFGERVEVAVDADRCRGIEKLQAVGCDVVLLDDAFQHRAVKAGLSLLLVDYHRLITRDRLLPAGYLREPASGKDRADIVIVSKCPAQLSPIDFRMVQDSLRLRPYQKLFFSTLRYGMLHQLFGNETRALASLGEEGISVMLLTSIGSPQEMEADLRQYTPQILPLHFPDHHYYSTTDVARIRQTFNQLPEPRIVVTTEKDATRLFTLPDLGDELRSRIYVLPIEVEIMRNEDTMFNKKILDYVRKNR